MSLLTAWEDHDHVGGAGFNICDHAESGFGFRVGLGGA